MFNPYLTQVEVQDGVVLTYKVGFNLGEFADFILGWRGLDFLDDDMSRKKTK